MPERSPVSAVSLAHGGKIVGKIVGKVVSTPLVRSLS